MADINALTEQMKVMPVQKKIAMLAVVALLIAAIFMLVTWVQKTDYQLLFANLSQEDGGAIIQKLNELRVPYRTEGGGIMVPADKVYELRLQLAGQGLPQGGGVGFELFDKTNFTMTDFVQKLNYRRALQGELSRTIRALTEIDQCRVHLVVPEKSLFMQKESKPKASVLIKLKSGRRLTQAQVQGIVHLVSSSVEGLDPNDVSVVNSTGEMLTAAVDENMAMSSGQLDYQRNYERDLETRVMAMLEPVVGKGKVRAKISVAVDFTKMEKTEEKYDPDGQVVRSEQRNTEKSSSGTPAGVPGIASNLPEKTPTVTTKAQPATSEKKNETINYEISKVVSRVVSPTGEVKRISAVVLVDGTYAAQQAGSKELKYVARTEEALQQFEDMVKKAVGFTANRGDEVKVVNMPFETSPQEEFAEADKGFIEKEGIMGMARSAIKYVVPLVAVILLFLFVVKPLMKALSMPSSAPRPAMQLPQTVAQLERAIEPRERSGGREQVVDWAKKNPKDAATLVKGWLEER